MASGQHGVQRRAVGDQVVERAEEYGAVVRFDEIQPVQRRVEERRDGRPAQFVQLRVDRRRGLIPEIEDLHRRGFVRIILDIPALAAAHPQGEITAHDGGNRPVKQWRVLRVKAHLEIQQIGQRSRMIQLGQQDPAL